MCSSTFSTAASVDQRALREHRAQSRCRLSVFDCGGELLGKGVVNAVLHVEAVGADAGLPGVAVLGNHGAFDRRIEIGIIEHDEGRIAAELQGKLLDGGGSSAS